MVTAIASDLSTDSVQVNLPPGQSELSFTCPHVSGTLAAVLCNSDCLPGANWSYLKVHLLFNVYDVCLVCVCACVYVCVCYHWLGSV